MDEPTDTDHDGRPRPQDAVTVSLFVDALRRLKDWSGLSYRKLEKRATAAGDVLPRATLTTALHRDSLPREELVVALVRACGGNDDEVTEWANTRRRLAAADQTTMTDQQSEPITATPARRPLAFVVRSIFHGSRRVRVPVIALALLLGAVVTGSLAAGARNTHDEATPATSVEVFQGLPANRDAHSACHSDRACIHPAENLSGAWTNPVQDTNNDLFLYPAIGQAESVENNRASCSVTFYSERNQAGPSFVLKPFEWANLDGTVWYHHIGSNIWCS